METSTLTIKNNTIVDSFAGLVWIRYPQRLFPQLLKYDQGSAVCKKLDYAGSTQWFIPTNDQLTKFFNSYKSIITEHVFLPPCWLWTSTPRPFYQEQYIVTWNGENFYPESATRISHGNIWPVCSLKDFQTIKIDQEGALKGVELVVV